MASYNPEASMSLIKRLCAYCSTLYKAQTRETVDLVFFALLIFTLTCIGSMLMICFFFEMEKRSLPQTESQQAPAVFSADLPLSS